MRDSMLNRLTSLFTAKKRAQATRWRWHPSQAAEDGEARSPRLPGDARLEWCCLRSLVEPSELVIRRLAEWRQQRCDRVSNQSSEFCQSKQSAQLEG